jgi:hypothetical protein
MDLTGIGAIFDFGSKLVDKIFPDKIAQEKERNAAQLAIMQMTQSGELEQLKVSLSAILAEAQSADPWTSRARPSFLYVVYVLLLWSIPMGILSIFAPEAAVKFTEGFGAWMKAIPDPILQLFGVVMTGYVLGRSWEKVKGASK